MRALAILLIGVAAMFATPANAYTVRGDPGGNVDQFILKYENLRQTGEPVVVDGLCASACTLMLGILPASQIAVTRRAVFGFHMASYPADDRAGHMTLVLSHSGTKMIMGYYPPFIKRWIRKHGGLTPHLIMLRGTQLPREYKRVQ